MSSSDHYRQQGVQEDRSSGESFVHVNSSQVPALPDKKPRRMSWLSNLQDKRKSKRNSMSEEPQGMTPSDSFYGSVASPARVPVRGDSVKSYPAGQGMSFTSL